VTGKRPLVAVLDYGIGNLRSAEKALEHVGADARLTADPGVIREAGGVVLPGVGAFGRCMEALRGSRLDSVALDAVHSGRPFLGICIGAQMLFDTSEEDPGAQGLGVLAGQVRLLPPTVKRPQMQWNVLDVVRPHPLLEGLPARPWMYFLHSFHPVPDDPDLIVATCDYGVAVTALAARGNVAAAQFHPEKSGTDGLALLGAFVQQVAASVPA
jgi:glutamine amidotransferase